MWSRLAVSVCVLWGGGAVSSTGVHCLCLLERRTDRTDMDTIRSAKDMQNYTQNTHVLNTNSVNKMATELHISQHQTYNKYN